MKNLSRKHQQILQSNRENLIVYREMKLSNDEFNQVHQNKGKLISMKGFFMAYTHWSSTLTLFISSIQQTNFIPVLFEIKCNVRELGNSVTFTDVTQFNKPASQQTILFDFNATFRLDNIQQDEQMWIIILNAVSDGRTIKQKYIDDTHRQIENLSISIIFGQLICDISQWNLLNDSYDED
jgi:hypothetical protein